MHGITGVNNIFDQDQIAAFDIDGQVKIVSYLAGAGSAAKVRGQLNKTNLNGHSDVLYQVGHKKEAAGKYANQYRFSSGVIGFYLFGKFFYAVFYLSGRD